MKRVFQSVGRATIAATLSKHRTTRRKALIFSIAALCFIGLVLGVKAYNVRSERRSGIPARQLGVSSGGSNLRAKLSRQPEADRLRRRLGRRFLQDGREVSVITGFLTIGANRQPVRIARTQRDEGERVEVSIGGRQTVLGWDSNSGASSDGGSVTAAERALLERLSLDSVDQFIQAQVRGASYYVVARDVRPPGLGNSDDYDGPVWDVVRVTEPSEAPGVAPLSRARHYFINSATGLIERIASVEQGIDIVADFSGWMNQAGEVIPTHIVWTQNQQIVMDLSINGFSNVGRQ